MAHFIHGSSSSADGKLVHLDSSDDEGPSEVKINHSAVRSFRGDRSNFEVGFPNNGLLSEIHGKIPEIDGMIAKLMAIFPQLSPDQALFQLLKTQGQLSQEMALQVAIDHFLRHGVPDVDLPVEIGSGRIEIDSDRTGTSHRVEKQDNFELKVAVPAEADYLYEDWSLYRLSEDFPLVRMSDIRQAFKAYNKNFTHTYKAVEWVCKNLLDSGKRKSKRDTCTSFDLSNTSWIPKSGLKLMRSPRPKKNKPNTISKTFDKEWDALQKESIEKLQGDHLRHSESSSEGEAKSTNEECSSADENIECGCCCMEFSFEKMVQCADGHLFCFQCLRKHVEESTFGGFLARASLPCMDTSGCEESIPMSEVRRTLPVDVIERYEQRQAQADIEQAKLEGLVYCPFCNFPCEVDKDVRVLECPNSKCLKASCIQCKEPSHVPLRCEEVEKKSETALRRRIEEDMTKAVIRVCNSCKAELVKSDGCNKVTCRCGTTMCYICRKTIAKDYSHFCQHAREPGKPCHQCKKCGLWEKEVDDNLAVDAREKALKELAGEEPKLLGRNIGPPIKKQKESSSQRHGGPFGLLPHAIFPGQHIHLQPQNPAPLFGHRGVHHLYHNLPFPLPNLNFPVDHPLPPLDLGNRHIRPFPLHQDLFPAQEGNENRPAHPPDIHRLAHPPDFLTLAVGNQLNGVRNEQVENWPHFPLVENQLNGVRNEQVENWPPFPLVENWPNVQREF